MIIKFILITNIMTQSYDIGINDGRVMDPETGFDGIRNVGIRGDRIVEITTKSIRGKVVINAKGLVVSPGFIDLHAHGQTNEAHEYQARDGVTTALEMEGGVGFFACASTAIPKPSPRHIVAAKTPRFKAVVMRIWLCKTFVIIIIPNNVFVIRL